MEAFYIHLLSSVETAFHEVYEDYVENCEKFEIVVIDLQNRRVTEKKSAMLFGRLLMEEPLREIYVDNLREKDIQSLFRGIDAVFAKKYPEGIVTCDGCLIKRPEIEITLPDEGQTLAKIALGQETRETMMVKDVECGNVVYVPLDKSKIQEYNIPKQ